MPRLSRDAGRDCVSGQHLCIRPKATRQFETRKFEWRQQVGPDVLRRGGYSFLLGARGDGQRDAKAGSSWPPGDHPLWVRPRTRKRTLVSGTSSGCCWILGAPYDRPCQNGSTLRWETTGAPPISTLSITRPPPCIGRAFRRHSELSPSARPALSRRGTLLVEVRDPGGEPVLDASGRGRASALRWGTVGDGRWWGEQGIIHADQLRPATVRLGSREAIYERSGEAHLG